MDRQVHVGDRIRQLRLERGLTQRQLAQALGVTEATVVRWETGARQPRVGIIKRLAQFFQVSPQWLLRGEEPRTVERIPGRPRAVYTDFRLIPIIDGYVGAGGAGYVLSRHPVGHLGVPKIEALTWVEPFAMKVGADQESMIPTVNPGDYVVIDTNPNQPVRSGKIYLLRDPQDHDGLTIKRVEIVAELRCRLISDNPAYPPIDWEGDIRQLIIGQVVAIIRLT